MKLIPWKRNRREQPDREGVQRSREILRKVEADDIPVRALADAHRRKLRENHLGPRFRIALKEAPR